MSHTPGPWNISGLDPTVIGFQKELNPNFKTTFRSVARVYERLSETQANARLIAAAPELLEACKALQMEARARNCGLRIADEAIAKAEGK